MTICSIPPARVVRLRPTDGHGAAAVAAGLAFLLVAAPTSPHELAIDQLVLWSDGERLRGELTFDPASTRPDGAKVGEHARAEVLALVQRSIRLRAGGETLPFEAEVRELWVPGGPVGGDLVTLSAELKSDRERPLEIASREPLLPLVITVRAPSSESRMASHSWLSNDSSWSPPFPLGKTLPAEPPPGWSRGDASELTAPKPKAPSDAPSPPVATTPPRPSRGSLLTRFGQLGFEHVLPLGLDHLAFVAALVLACAPRWGTTLATLTAFTLAHSLTLALGSLEIVAVPSSLVEPSIALSVLIMGVRSAMQHPEAWPRVLSKLRPRRRTSSAGGWATSPGLLAFGFGLLHGLGFAGALRRLSLDGGSLWVALLGFNLGVEVAQLFAASALGLILTLANHIAVRGRSLQPRLIFLTSTAVAVIGALLLIDRASSGVWG